TTRSRSACCSPRTGTASSPPPTRPPCPEARGSRSSTIPALAADLHTAQNRIRAGGCAMDDPGIITALLARVEQGDAAARDALLPIVYDELRRVARRLLSGELGNVSL